MQALILAGGEGTRLRPLTEAIPKPVLPLAGRPHIAYVIDWVAAHGVDDVVVSCGHLAEGVREALAGMTGVRVSFVEEPEARGTAGAIRYAADELGGLAECFFVLNGDVLCDLDLGALAEQHRRSGARATIALHPVADPGAYGLVLHGPGGEITEFLEKPSAEAIARAGSDEINAGAYLLERSVLERIPPGRAVSIEREVFPALVGDGLYGRRLEGHWIDIGTPERYLQANWDILERRLSTVTGERIGPDGLLISPGAEVHGEAAIAGPAMIADGVRVGAGAGVGPRAVLGAGGEVGEGATVTGSVLLERCTVGAGARLEGAILAPGAVVAPDAALAAGSVAGPGELVEGMPA